MQGRHRALALAVTAVTAASAPAALASTVRVEGGVLSIGQAPAESTRVSLVRIIQAPPGEYTVGGGFAEARYSDTAVRWPGTAPGAGAGCMALQYAVGCPGVSRIAVAFGDGDDSAVVLTNGDPVAGIALSGGGGRDALQASEEVASLDGGPGDDVLMLAGGSANGGEGDDYIGVTGGDRVTIDCGPGHDMLRRVTAGAEADPRDTGGMTVDAASCPPLLTPLIAQFAHLPGKSTVFYVPRDRKLTVPLFRTNEAVTGTMSLRRTNGGRACAPPVRFRAAAGRAVNPKFTLAPWLVRAVAPLGPRRGVSCTIRFSGTDAQGEPFNSREHPHRSDAPNEAYTHFLFVSSRATNGRRP